MKKSQQLEENRKWYEDRGIDVDTLILKEKEAEEAVEKDLLSKQ